MTLGEAREIIVSKVQDLNPLQYTLEGSDAPIEERLASLETRFKAEADLSPFRTNRVVEICRRIAECFGVTPAEVVPNLLGTIPAGTSSLPESTILPEDIERLVRDFESFPFEQIRD